MKKSIKIIISAIVLCILGGNVNGVYGKAAPVKPKVVRKNFEIKYADVNKDGINEKIYFNGIAESGSDGDVFLYDNVYVIVQDTKTKKIIAKAVVGDYANGYGNSLSFEDFNGDGIKEIMAVLYVGGTDGRHECKMYTLKNKKLEELSTETNAMWDSKLVRDGEKYLVEFTADFSKKKYVIDISTDDYINFNPEQSYDINMDGRGPMYSMKDIDNDGKMEFVVSDECDGTCHGDPLANVNLYFKYDKAGKWIPVDYDIEAFYPAVK